MKTLKEHMDETEDVSRLIGQVMHEYAENNDILLQSFLEMQKNDLVAEASRKKYKQYLEKVGRNMGDLLAFGIRMEHLPGRGPNFDYHLEDDSLAPGICIKHLTGRRPDFR